jgi:hypothetical protein
MKDFRNWKNVASGIYRFAISSNACYEISIDICRVNKDFDDIIASLFLVGDFYSKDKIHFFVRKCLLQTQPVCACIETAKLDYINKEKRQ